MNFIEIWQGLGFKSCLRTPGAFIQHFTGSEEHTSESLESINNMVTNKISVWSKESVRRPTIYCIVLNKRSLCVDRHLRKHRVPRWPTEVFFTHFSPVFQPFSLVLGVYSIKTWVCVVRKGVGAHLFKHVHLFSTIQYLCIQAAFLRSISVLETRGTTYMRSTNIL